MKYKHTDSELFFVNKFCKNIIKNIDDRDFMDSRNKKRNFSKVYEDNLKGKLAEVFIFNQIANLCDKPKMDFDIYEKGVGDNFDIQSSNFNIDVKASSPKAKCIMIEGVKLKTWRKTIGLPDYLCMVSVTNENNIFYSEYLFGVDFSTFVKKCKLYKRGSNIPNTNVPLKADNFIITKPDCFSNIEHLKEKVN